MGGLGYAPFSDPFQGQSPSKYSDDLGAFVYYGLFGLVDPKMPVEAFVAGGGSLIDESAAAARGTPGGWGFRAPSFWGALRGVGMSVGAAMLLTGTIGWFLDPKGLREGGYDEWTSDEVSYSGYGMGII